MVSFLAYLINEPRWIVRVPAGKEHDLDAIEVVARSALELFQKLAQPGDPYFLRPGVPLHGSLRSALGASASGC
jgi:hypothetical protein